MYTIIEDFSGGWDVRKSGSTTRPGSLLKLDNAFVNAGGEIEKRKTMTKLTDLPPETIGLGFRQNKAYVFGTVASVTGLPAYVEYQQLATAGKTISRVLKVTPFANKLYVVTLATDGTVQHFYDGAEILSLRNEGRNARAHKTKMYVADGENLRFSAINNPADTTGTGSGLIDITAEDTGSANILGIEQYYSQLAVFGDTSVQIWAMDPDPLNNTQVQVLGNIGLVAPNGLARYGNGDVLFLSHTGIRSLRARDSSNAAVLNDIGSPIDNEIALRRAILTPDLAEKITGLVDPLSGHFWLIWNTEVFLLSYYPSSSVTAWSRFLPNVSMDYVTLANSRIAIRSGNELFVYGTVPPSGSPFDVNAPVGADPAQYDASPVEVILPFMSFGKPATVKKWRGIDIAATGLWDVYANPSPKTPNTWTKIGENIDGDTFDYGRLQYDAESTHLALRLVNNVAGPAKLSSVTVHYDTGEDS